MLVQEGQRWCKGRLITPWGLLLLWILGTSSCSSDQKQANTVGFTLLPSTETGVAFANKIIESPERNIHRFDHFYNGGGVAIGDVNNDGKPDIFFTGNDNSNTLYLNKGDMQFEDVTAAAGLTSDKWSNGANMVDLNNDGYLDIYVSNGGPELNTPSLVDDLYINNGDGTFSNKSAAYGITSQAKSIQSAFFDYDNDGDLDLWVNCAPNFDGNISQQELLEQYENQPDELRTLITCQLYENTGTAFKDVTIEAGVDKVSFGLGLHIDDLDGDGWLDVLVHNDYFIPDYVFINQGNKTFADKAKNVLGQTSNFSMGSDMADLNNDGLLDMIVVDMSPADHYRSKVLMNSMNVSDFYWRTITKGYIPQYMNNSMWLGTGKGTFAEMGSLTGSANTDWSWAPLIADFDNDGLRDLFVTNGFYRETKNNDARAEAQRYRDSIGADKYDYVASYENLKRYAVNPIPNNYFKNYGDLRLQEEAKKYGLAEPSLSNGAAYGDLDGDGDLDLVINNQMSVASIYENNAHQNYLRVALTDDGCGEYNATVNVYAKGQRWVAKSYYSRGYQSAVEPVLHFGIGGVEVVDSLTVTWLDGSMTTKTKVTANTTLTIDKKGSAQQSKSKPEKPLFRDVTKSIASFKDLYHEDDFYNDFDREILLPHKYSSLGAPVAVGDLNGDGRQDVVLGGGAGYPMQVLLQGAKDFDEAQVPVLAADRDYEDLAIELLDVDGDGDLDIYAASGGGGDIKDKALLQDRLYMNGGGMVFQKTTLPAITRSTKTVLPIDYDQDGDLDLFVGGRNVPSKYPQLPRSYFLENIDGVYTDKSKESGIEGIVKMMVTDGVVADVDGDGDEDIVLVGEWSSPHYLQNDGKQFTKQQLVSTDLQGLWQSVHAVDIDGDGDLDFVLGNLGLNNKFTGSKKKTLKLFANDFDDNGSLDIVLAKKYKDELVPVRGKECSSQQMPFLEDKFDSYHSFASSTLADIYTEEKLAEALELTADVFHHVVLRKESSRYQVDTLPMYAQIGPILDMVSGDYNSDGLTDLLAVGAIQDTEPETRAYDSNRGLLMLGRPDGKLEVVYDISQSGIYLTGNTKSITPIQLGNEFDAIIAAKNNGKVQLLIQSR